MAVSLAMKTEGRQGLPTQFSGTVHVVFTEKLRLKRKKVSREG